MVESRCGILCNKCEYREKMDCQGCIEIHKPFWGDSCPVKSADTTIVGNLAKQILIRNFNVHKFIFDVVNQNADALKAYFVPDAIICWHDSNEQFTVGEYIRANCEYPNDWNGEIQRIENIESGLILVTRIFSDELTVFVTAFIKLSEGKITRLDEYYAGVEEVPEWRREMNIGRPITTN